MRFCRPTAAFSRMLLALCGVAVLASELRSQPPPTLPFARLTTVTPAGGKAGTNVEVVIGGADLEECTALYFSHPGITATPMPDPMKAGSFIPNKFTVTIAANVPVGNHDVRAISRYGISNPRAFVVGDQNEVVEAEPNNDVPQAQKVELGSTVNGVVSSNVDVDYYRFAAKQGQRVIIHCAAERIDSRLNPCLELFDARNRLLAANHRYAGREAFIAFLVPADGEYLLRVTEHAHLQGHGNPEFFYRLTISLGPWIEAAHPRLVDPTKPSQVTLYGYNLPNSQPDAKSGLEMLSVTINPPNDPLDRQRMAFSSSIAPPAANLDGVEYRLKGDAGHSNPILLIFAGKPFVLDNEDNEAADKPQEIAVPCEVCGRFEKPRDRDWYLFSAKANEVFVIEALGERLGAPMDLYFELYRIDSNDPKVRQPLGEFDDLTEAASLLKFNTSTRDPRTRFVAPSDGRYLLMIGHRDSELRAGPRYSYILDIRKEAPDFRLIAIDSHDSAAGAPLVRAGSSQYLEVFCLRSDGFAGEVTLTVEGLPAGVTCPPQTIAGPLRQTTLVITAAADAAPWNGPITIKGSATLNGQPVVREVRAACQVWPTQPGGGVVAVSRLTHSLCLAVADKAVFTLTPEVQELSVPAGGAISLKIKVVRHAADFKNPIQLSAISQVAPPPPQPAPPPPIGNIPPDRDEAAINIPVAGNAAPGTYNLAIRGNSQYPFAKDPKAPQKPPVNLMELAPPIKVTVYNTVAEVALSDPNPMLKIGTDTELVVKVNRTNGYQGAFRVQLVLPQGFQGISAAEAMIPENANETKLVLKVPANAAPANNPNVVVRAIATVGNVTLNNDARLNVTIVK